VVDPVYAATGIETSGTAWTATGVLATGVIIGFTLATWGLFRRTFWWEAVANLSAVAGLVALVPYWIAADDAGVANPAFDVVIHAVGSVGVLLLLHVPTLERWVRGHVVAGG
jgi:hypothetical protein